MEDNSNSPALAWGYRWDGAANGRAMLQAIVEADDRLYIKFNDRGDADPGHVDPTLVYGLGYDTDNDGVFGIGDGTPFNEFGKAFGHAPFFGTGATDLGDYYAEGWEFAFWHYGVESPDGTNPYDAGDWSSTTDGIVTRDLIDGSWDSWAFEGSTAISVHSVRRESNSRPVAVPARRFRSRLPKWTQPTTPRGPAPFGSTTYPAADANHDGIVDTADYIVLAATISPRQRRPLPPPQLCVSVSEPSAAALSIITLLVSHFAIRANADERR